VSLQNKAVKFLKTSNKTTLDKTYKITFWNHQFI